MKNVDDNVSKAAAAVTLVSTLLSDEVERKYAADVARDVNALLYVHSIDTLRYRIPDLDRRIQMLSLRSTRDGVDGDRAAWHRARARAFLARSLHAY